MASVEIFHSSQYPGLTYEDGSPVEPGFYFWFCQPGCLPDSEPIGAFETYADAAAASELELTEADLDVYGNAPIDFEYEGDDSPSFS